MSDRFGRRDRIQTGNRCAIHFTQTFTLSQARRQTVKLFQIEHSTGRAHQMHIGPRLLNWLGLRDLNHLVDPVLVHGSIATVAREQRDRHAGNARQKYLIDSLFQYIQTGDSDDGVDVPAHNNFQHDGRAFSNQYFVTHCFGLTAKISDTTGAAFLAIQSKIVIVRRTAFGMLQAMRQEKKAS